MAKFKFWDNIKKTWEILSDLPKGGSKGQVLLKKSNNDYDVQWKTVAAEDLPKANGATGGIVVSSNDIAFVDGVPTVKSVGGFTVEKSVPSDAKFTDTIYTLPDKLPISMIDGAPATTNAVDNIGIQTEGNSISSGGFRIGNTKFSYRLTGNKLEIFSKE